jgi:hypothetical protein
MPANTPHEMMEREYDFYRSLYWYHIVEILEYDTKRVGIIPLQRAYKLLDAYKHLHHLRQYFKSNGGIQTW